MDRNLRSNANPTAYRSDVITNGIGAGQALALLGSTAWTTSARVALAVLVGTLTLASVSDAYALPLDGTVAAGTASITGSKSAVTVTQSSQNAVINWQSFSIGKSESVTFQQPGKSSVTLNRVQGSDPSAILGKLSANGQIFLVNPNGVLFAKGAQVNVGGLVASTLGISDANFIAGNYKFSGASSAAVVNKGSIAANGGYVALLGARVDNEGLITARLGSVVLAAGSAITLDVAGNGLLNVAVDEAAVNALVKNGGVIRANGGQVVMTAHAAGALMKTVVNNTGVIEAQTIDARNGTIKLLGDTASGTVAVSGTLDATGTNPGQTGGNVVVTGNTVALRGHAKISASGAAGGGTVLVGGSLGTTSTVPLAASTTMGKAVVVSADAITTGNGGSVVLRSSGLTQALGTITARGGAQSGNGGQVETSGLQVKTGPTTLVDTLAPHGATGSWLLDPINYTIATTGGDETPASVAISLATSNRLITATNDITVANAVTWSTPQTLTLQAGNLVTVNAPITAGTAGAGLVITGGQGVAINAPLTASGIGNVIQLNATRGDLNINAAVTASASGALVQLNAGHDVNVNVSDGLTPGGVVTASGGGAITFVADTLGVPGPTGGAVNICPTCAVTSTSVTVYYSPPNGYGSPTPYTGFTAYEWVFVAANNKVYDGTTAATARFFADPTVGGTIDVNLIGGTIGFVDKNVGPAKPVTFSGYSISGAGAPAYALFSGSGITTAAITPAPLTVTANSAAKIYGQTVTLAPTAFTSAGLQGGDTIAGVTETSPGAIATAAVAGSPYAIAVGNAIGGSYVSTNYTTTYVPGVLTITPAALTVTANSATKTYGQAITLSPSAFTSAGLQNGDTIAAVTEASPGVLATAGVAGSPYAIVPSNAAGGTYVPANYTTTYLPGVLSVTPAALQVTADSVGKTYGQAIVLGPTAFTAVGLKNGDTIGGVTEGSSGAVATAAVAGGPYAITASNAVGGSYTPANYATTYHSGALTVTPAALTVTADDAVKTYGQAIAFPPTAFAAVGLKNGDTIAGVTETSPGTAATSTVGSYVITASDAVGGSYVPTNYSTTYVGGQLTTVPAVTVPVVTLPLVPSPVVTTPIATPPVLAPPIITPPVGTAAGGSGGTTGTGSTPDAGTTQPGATQGGTTLGGTTIPSTTVVVMTPDLSRPAQTTNIDTGNGDNTQGGVTSVQTERNEAANGTAVAGGTTVLIVSSGTVIGTTGSSVVGPTGVPMAVVDQGVRMPAFAAAPARPGATMPLSAMPDEYPRKPDRN